MFDKYLNKYRLCVLIVADVSAIVISYLGAFILRFDFTIPSEYFSYIYIWLPIYIITKIGIFKFGGLYKSLLRYTSLWDMVNIVRATLVATLFLTLVFGVTQGFEGFPRSIFILDFILTSFFVGSIRISIRLYFSHFQPMIKKENNIQKIRLVIIGAGETGEQITREINSYTVSPYKVVAFVDDNQKKMGANIHGIKIYGPVELLNKLPVKYDELLIAIPTATGNEMRRIVEYCKITGKPYKTVPSISEIINNDISLQSVREVSYHDLLGREEVQLDKESITKFLKDEIVLVTGAGGSIGSELVRQCLNYKPKSLILLDNSEFNLFSIEQKLLQMKIDCSFQVILADVRDNVAINRIFEKYTPTVVLHSAAYKHVPLQEANPREAVLTNVLGTKNIMDSAMRFHVKKYILVSTDKAVNPTNIMGATKHLAEKIIHNNEMNSGCTFAAVRFGNVIGSSGSVIPIFQEQIKNGGPVRITHPEMTRYFMSIPEAAHLILQAGAFGKGGETFILDMGRPINIKDLAFDLIRLNGLEPERDIRITYTGIRPGEKLKEELTAYNEKSLSSIHPKINMLKNHISKSEANDFSDKIEELIEFAQSYSNTDVKNKLRLLVPEYRILKYSS